MTTTQTREEPAIRLLTAHDQCDRCGAQAWIRTILTTDQTLQWCCHCWRDTAPKIRAKGLLATVIDESKHLKEES